MPARTSEHIIDLARSSYIAGVARGFAIGMEFVRSGGAPEELEHVVVGRAAAAFKAWWNKAAGFEEIT